MKRILIICVLILLTSPIYAQMDIGDTVIGVGYESGNELIRAKGEVTTIKVVNRNLLEPNKSHQDKFILFDKSGNVKEYTQNTMNPGTAYTMPYFKLLYTYNKDGRIRQRLTKDTTGKEQLAYHYKYNYRAPDKLTRIVAITNNEDIPIETTTDKLDSIGRVIEKSTDSHRNSSTTTARYEYYGSGRLATYTRLRTEPSKGEGKLKVSYKAIYFHDKSKDRTYSLLYKADKAETQPTADLQSIDTIDNNHPLIVKADIVTIRTRNQMGDITEMVIRQNGKEASLVYNYTYDAKGNWITRTLFTNGRQEPFITERTIKYRK